MSDYKYKIKIIYDTGDSFNQQSGVEEYIELQFKRKDTAKKALKDIEEHYHLYMLCSKEWNISKEQKEEAIRESSKKLWFHKKNHMTDIYFRILLEDDDGKRVEESVFWAGYFESLVGADIERIEDSENISFRI